MECSLKCTDTHRNKRNGCTFNWKLINLPELVALYWTYSHHYVGILLSPLNSSSTCPLISVYLFASNAPSSIPRANILLQSHIIQWCAKKRTSIVHFEMFILESLYCFPLIMSTIRGGGRKGQHGWWEGAQDVPAWLYSTRERTVGGRRHKSRSFLRMSFVLSLPPVQRFVSLIVG